jgi:hypothetical protein
VKHAVYFHHTKSNHIQIIESRRNMPAWKAGAQMFSIRKHDPHQAPSFRALELLLLLVPCKEAAKSSPN